MFWLLIACSPHNAKSSQPSSSDTAVIIEDEVHPDLGCFSTPPEVEAQQVLIYSTPYTEDAGQSSAWHAALINDDGSGISSWQDFELGRQPLGEIIFTPDGSLGFIAQEDGSIGQFRITETGIEVLETNFTGEWYASSLWFDPYDSNLWIIDSNWPENGGGIYIAPLDCSTGQIGNANLVLTTKNALGVVPVSPERVVLAAREAGENTSGHIFLLDRQQLDILSSSSLFDHDDAILSALTWTGSHLIVGDNSSFSSSPNRIAYTTLSGIMWGSTQQQEVLDPVSLLPNESGDLVLISSGFGDELYSFSPTNGELTAIPTTPSSALPGKAVYVQRGVWAGSAIVPENTLIRRLSFSGSTALDQGSIHQGSGLAGIIGALGISP